MATAVPGNFKPGPLSFARLGKMIDWMAKNKLNVISISIKKYETLPKSMFNEIKKRGVAIAAEGHSWPYFLDQGKKQGASIDCVQEEKVINGLVEKIVGFTKKHGEIRMLGPWGKDNSDWTLCRNSFGGSRPPERAAVFYDKLASAMKTAGCDPRLMMIAYQKFLLPPVGQSFPLDTLVYICPIDRDYGKLFQDPASTINARYVNAGNIWKQRGFSDNRIFYSYYRKHSWHSLPVNTPFHMAQEMSWLHQEGFAGANTYLTAEDWLAYDIQHLVYAALCWNVNADVSSILADYMKTFFGDQWKPMYDLHVNLEKLTLKLDGGGYFGYSVRGMAKNSLAEIDGAVENLKGMQSLIARSKAGWQKDSPSATMLKTREHWIKYWLLKLEAAKNYKQKSPMRAASIDAMQRFLVESTPNGLVHGGFLNDAEFKKDSSKF
jgi:hypothetical protein